MSSWIQAAMQQNTISELLASRNLIIGSPDGWIMISFCQEMAFLANKSTGKNGKKWDIIDSNFEYATCYVL